MYLIYVSPWENLYLEYQNIKGKSLYNQLYFNQIASVQQKYWNEP